MYNHALWILFPCSPTAYITVIVLSQMNSSCPSTAMRDSQTVDRQKNISSGRWIRKKHSGDIISCVQPVCSGCYKFDTECTGGCLFKSTPVCSECHRIDVQCYCINSSFSFWRRFAPVCSGCYKIYTECRGEPVCGGKCVCTRCDKIPMKCCCCPIFHTGFFEL